MKVVVIVVAHWVVAILETLVAALVLSCFWRWFILPGFAAVPALSYRQAVGVMVVVDVFLASAGHSRDRIQITVDKLLEDKPSEWSALLWSVGTLVIGWPVTFGLGWVLRYLVMP